MDFRRKNLYSAISEENPVQNPYEKLNLCIYVLRCDKSDLN